MDICEVDRMGHVSIAWSNLTVSVNTFVDWKWSKKVLLNQLTGSCTVGTVNGFLGPSGAGKTTLLNCLAGHAPSVVSDKSKIFVQSSISESVESVFIGANVGELVPGSLTIGQILRYAYQFKNGIGASAEKVSAHVQSTMKALMLREELEDRRFSDCSGGEQKRVAIAQELMGKRVPDFLFLDEPTTGLDSSAAFEIVRCLHDLVTQQSGLTVLASIHVPNHRTLALFDQLYVLSKGGQCIYSGSPIQIETFLKAEIQQPFSNSQPPIEVLINLASGSQPVHQSFIGQLSAKIQNAQTVLLSTEMPSLCHLPNGLPHRRKEFSLSDFATQMQRTFRLTFISDWRSLIYSYLIYTAVLAIIISTYTFDMVFPSGCIPQNSTCQPDLMQATLLQENFFFLCFSMYTVSLLVMVTSTIAIILPVKVFLNEHRNGWHSLGAFAVSLTTISVLSVSLLSLLLSVVIFYGSGQNAIDGSVWLSLARYSNYLFILWLNVLYSQTIGQLIGFLLFRQPNLAVMGSVLTAAFMFMTNDFFLKSDEATDPLFVAGAKIAAFKYITKYAVYVFYGINRCNTEMEMSTVLHKHHVDPGQVYFYIWRVGLNIVVVQLFACAMIYFQVIDLSQKLKRMFKAKKQRELPTQKEHEISVFFSETARDEQSDIIQLTESVGECTLKNRIIIGWRNLTLFQSSLLYNVSLSENLDRTPILCSLNGQFQFGTLNAIMGQSGAGKTSLLRVLNGRSKMRLSNQTQLFLSRFAPIQTVFVSQNVSGHLINGLTAKQLLTYSSRLKNAGMKADHEAIAQKIIEKLDLSSASETNAEKCSDGERKRLAVGLELTSLCMPNLLCIDEATSGLDSHSANIVISTLRRLSKGYSLTIVTSIHQPTSEILCQFDQLYVLARGGICVYSGPPDGITAHLDSTLGEQSTFQNTNCPPIENLIELACDGHFNQDVQRLSEKTHTSIVTAGELSLYTDTQLVADGLQPIRRRFSLDATFILFLRYLAYIRGYLWKQWLIFLFFTIFYAYVLIYFWDGPRISATSGCINIVTNEFNLTCSFATPQSQEDYKLLMDNYTFAFFFDYLFLFILTVQSFLFFFNELPFFINEQRNGWYSTVSFYLVKTIFDILPTVPLLLLYMAICDIYSTVIPGIYWKLVTLITLTLAAYQGIPQIFVIVCNGNLGRIVLLSISINILTLQISNYQVPLSRLHYVYQFLSTFSIARFNMESLMLLLYGFGRCSSEEIHPILYRMELADEDFWPGIGMLAFNLVFYRIFAIYLLLQKMNPKHQKKEISHLDKTRIEENILDNVTN